MKALVYHGPGRRQWEDKPAPVLQQPTDAIVRMTTTSICTTDLHILKGDIATVTDGRTLGHEGVGVIEEVGDAVAGFKKGDKVLISCATSCGKCDYCRRAMYSHCRNGGWLLGNRIDGTQAEYVRIPFADTGLYAVPPGTNDEAMVMLSDIFPIGYECGVVNARVQPGMKVAIVGAGPVGLAALMTAQFFSPFMSIVIDPDDNRLEVAKSLGATELVNSVRENAAHRVLAMTNGDGVDVAIEAVGIPDTFEICEAIISPGGRIANIGVHGKPAEIRLERLWDRNITITTRRVDTCSTPTLLKVVQAGRLRPERLVTHRFRLDDIMKAYDVFGNAARERALKVVLRND